MNDNNNGVGVTFFGLLTVLFIGLKLTKVINWSWGWVLAPLWMPAAVIIICAVVVTIINQLR